MNKARLMVAAAGTALALSLGGCWDDGDDTLPPVATPPAVPSIAGANAAAFIGYLLTLSAADDSSEPLLIGDTFAVPDDDTSEPDPRI